MTARHRHPGQHKALLRRNMLERIMKNPGEVTIYSMMATPFKEDGSLDLDSYAALLATMIDANIGVYLGSGGAGEGHALSPPELRDLYRVGVETCKGRVPVAANPREPRTARQMLDLAGLAAEAGVDLIQLYSLDAGHGMKPTRQELDNYYRFLLDRLECPIAISVHFYYPYPVAPRFVAELCADYPQIQAVNVIMPSAYFLEVRDEIADVGREIRLYTSMANFLEGLYAGSSGVQAAEPNLIPYTMRRLADAVLVGDADTVSELYIFVYNLIRVVDRWAPSTARWLKMGLRVLDLPGSNGVLREPYVLPGEDQLAEMANEFDRLDVQTMEAASAAAAAKNRCSMPDMTGRPAG
jgi:4-hydroxy-tetrahydrodipicolinate synthase